MSAYAITILVLAVAYTFYMGYSDGSNAVATCVASHSLKPYAAIVVSAICKFVTPLLLCYLIDSYGVAVTVASLINQSALTSGITPLAGFIFLLSTGTQLSRRLLIGNKRQIFYIKDICGRPQVNAMISNLAVYAQNTAFTDSSNRINAAYRITVHSAITHDGLG